MQDLDTVMAKTKSANVTFQRKAFTDVKADYVKIEDAIAGERQIKKKTSEYLPMPSSCSSTNDPVYKSYLLRAVYYNVCQPTLNALVGQLFLRAPIVNLPTILESLTPNLDGQGLGLEQLVRRAANHVLPYGRGGFLADFTKNNNVEVTRKDIEDGTARPVIRFYEPWAITNWLLETQGNKKVLTLLVLVETVEKEKSENEFEIEEQNQYRVYRMVGNECRVWVYDKDQKVVEQGRTVKDASGKAFTFIPFVCVGSENNDFEVDKPPFLNLANLNLAHYRNSADYEEGVYICGQPTPVFTGLTEEWLNMYYPKGIPFGARSAVSLPENCDAKLLQAEANSAAFEAMKHKEDQMFSIGAKIIDRSQKVEKKEKEVDIEASSQKSVLQTIKENLEKALLQSMTWAGMFVNETITDEHKIELNENFDLSSMSADELRSVFELYSGGLIAFTEARESLRRSGLAKLEDEEAQSEIREDLKFRKEVNPEPDTGKLDNQSPLKKGNNNDS